MNDDDFFRRDALDLQAFRRRYEDSGDDGSPCRCPGHTREHPGPGGRYLDVYLMRGLPTGALAFALVAWGLGELLSAAQFTFLWAMSLYRGLP